MRNHRKKHYNRSESTDYIQRIVLYFLIGFFCGAVFFYVFHNSFETMQAQFENNTASWSVNNNTFFLLWTKSLWNHGKYLLLFALVSFGRISRGYQNAFTVYTGVRNGLLLMFFIFFRGLYGIVLYFSSILPHALLLAPLYLFLFLTVQQKNKPRHKILFMAGLIFVFLTACVLEVKCSLPLLEMLL